ncbi:ThuA domain-containing protein [Pseudoclavibacter sp. RFBJ3]|uniref:ThuA domain-containing protein n=1 Tax=unclassified Pseudoclavibacter TaxID=2615177 RepID=UPI000CE778DF|nr:MULTISPECIES: ThuA domain-containing protein [unclassified Pseudoclavibacter]PPF87220.1 ThuA domain-containing protein [Pseudoclavibacter sp. RFBJ5]PPF89443.1 ThuA domain-containing protein [Pseudoclavibacter sp. RFBJ3]PPG00752.1 ThuA domain-containing protein [Pseudoclavibacter sp. RFBH5]PPG18860.1 ThuA domain-containing protein [Pseudoclavibacter sp. RFBI4]
MPAPLTALVLSGVGRYADPWHPFAETTVQLVRLLEDEGFATTVATDVDSVLSSDPPAPDLLVVNLGLPRDGEEVPAASAREGLRRLLGSGTPLLALHVSSTSFTDSPEWEEALGGRWVRGVSMHPEQDETQVQVVADPITVGIEDFTINDERYSHLRVADAVRTLLTHEHDGATHPLIWTRDETAEYGRAAYDALGHDARSFEAPEHRELLRRLVRWLRPASHRSEPRTIAVADPHRF